VTALLMALALAAVPAPKVKPISADGKATVYLMGDFSGGFNVAYGGVLRSMPANRARIVLDLMIVGAKKPGSSVELGLTRDARNGFGALRAFTAVRTRYGGYRYSEFPVSCAPACVLILRGDRQSFYALVAGNDAIRQIGAWRRTDFHLREPYVALNGEVMKAGDAIDGALTAVRVVAAARQLPSPACALTTRGILAHRLPGGTLTFSGTYRNDAPVSFIDLTRGRMVTRCPR
jgi:hypothetical protein